MKIYITAPFKGKENKEEIEKLCDIIRATWLEDFCFIRDMEKYEPIFADATELMNKAKEALLLCDCLLIEASQKTSTGCTIEAGMAYTMGKPVITIAKTGSDISKTLRWISSIVIEYNELWDIINPLTSYYLSLK